jgi:hypothetical protein
MNRALLVGINKYPTAPLRGCINDVVDIADLLVSKLGFAADDIRLLTDERATKQAIIERLGWLLTGLRAGDRVLFYYSGHGVQMATRNPQGEVDGLDEAICPVDFDWTDEHAIRDKEFNRIFAPIPIGVEFVWISDSCHSGDLLKLIMSADIRVKTITPPADIQWRIDVAKSKSIKALGIEKVAANINLALITGCKSNQTSADAVFNSRPNGALSYFLLQELSKERGLEKTLSQILESVNASLRQQHYSQEPQLEGNSLLHTRPFLSEP